MFILDKGKRRLLVRSQYRVTHPLLPWLGMARQVPLPDTRPCNNISYCLLKHESFRFWWSLICLLLVFAQYCEDLLLCLLRVFMVLNTKFRVLILIKFIFVCGMRRCCLHGTAAAPALHGETLFFWHYSEKSTDRQCLVHFPTLASHRILHVFLSPMKGFYWQDCLLYWLDS